MPTFRYRAKDGAKTITGSFEARSKEDAVDKLQYDGLIPVSVEEDRDALSRTPDAGSSPGPRRVRSKDLTVLTWQLAGLMKSGVPILRSLEILTRQTTHPGLKAVIDDIREKVKDGKACSAAMAEHPSVFPPIYLAMVRTGESVGNLQDVLYKVADYRQKQEEIIGRVRMAMAYPALMLFVGAGTILFMFMFVLPRLMQTFDSLGQELPLPTKILLSISSGLQQYWIYILIGLVLAVVFVQKGVSAEARRAFVSRLQLRLPVVSELVIKIEISRFCRTMEMMIKSGIPILSALETAVPVVGNDVIRGELMKSCADLKEGGSLGKSLERSGLLPAFTTGLVIVGEESGRLGEALAEIANAYTRDTDETIKMMTSLMEPLIILVMGLIVGFIVVSMLLPIFQINFSAG